MKKAIAIMVAVLILACLLLAGCVMTKNYFPESGIWYCEQLQMQLSFDRGKPFYDVFVYKGNEYACWWNAFDPGSTLIAIVYHDTGCPDYSPGDYVFQGVHVRGDETSFTLRELYGDREFEFVRVEEPVLDRKIVYR